MARSSTSLLKSKSDGAWPRLTTEIVVGTFRDVGRLHDALVALERAGIDGGDIRVGGEGVTRSMRIAETNFEVLETQLERRLWPRVAAGGLIGGVSGAAIGAVFIVAIGRDGVGPMLAAAVGFFLALGAVGALIGLFTGLATNAAWEATLVPASGVSWILVSSRDPKVLHIAEQVLRSADAERVRRVTSRPWGIERHDEPIS